MPEQLSVSSTNAPVPEQVKANRLKAIAALESGLYRFGTGAFYNDYTGCYCSLGVMILEVTNVRADRSCSITQTLSRFYQSVGIDEDDYDLYSEITRRNDDDNGSFELVAQYLRELWALPKEVRSEDAEVN